jgi:hypothetical protein
MLNLEIECKIQITVTGITLGRGFRVQWDNEPLLENIATEPGLQDSYGHYMHTGLTHRLPWHQFPFRTNEITSMLWCVWLKNPDPAKNCELVLVSLTSFELPVRFVIQTMWTFGMVYSMEWNIRSTAMPQHFRVSAPAVAQHFRPYCTVPFRPNVQVTGDTGSWTEHIWPRWRWHSDFEAQIGRKTSKFPVWRSPDYHIWQLPMIAEEWTPKKMKTQCTQPLW